MYTPDNNFVYNKNTTKASIATPSLNAGNAAIFKLK